MGGRRTKLKGPLAAAPQKRQVAQRPSRKQGKDLIQVRKEIFEATGDRSHLAYLRQAIIEEARRRAEANQASQQGPVRRQRLLATVRQAHKTLQNLPEDRDVTLYLRYFEQLDKKLTESNASEVVASWPSDFYETLLIQIESINDPEGLKAFRVSDGQHQLVRSKRAHLLQGIDIEYARLLKTYDIDPELFVQSKEDELDEDKGAENEFLSRFQEVMAQYSSNDGDVATPSPTLITELEAKLNEEDKELFLDDLTLIFESGLETSPAEFETAVRELASFSPMEREIIRHNMEQADGQAHDFDGKTLVLIEQIERGEPFKPSEIGKVATAWDQLRAKIYEGVDQPQSDSDLPNLGLLQTEIQLVEGLLVGAAEVSPEVEAVAKELTQRFIALQKGPKTDVGTRATQQGAKVLVKKLPIIRQIRAGAKLYNLGVALESLQQSYKDFLFQLESMPRQIESFRQQFEANHTMLVRASREYQQLMSQVEAPENIEAIQEKLDKEMGEKLALMLKKQPQVQEIMAHLYLPEDVTPSEMLTIFQRMGDGVAHFQILMRDYRSSGDMTEARRQQLIIQATECGRLLYPVVGLLAQALSDRMVAANEELNNEDLAEQFYEELIGGGSSSDGQRRKRKKKGLQLFGKKKSKRRQASFLERLKGRRKSSEAREKALLPAAKKGRQELGEYFEKASAGQSWAAHFWVRWLGRRELRKLNKARRKWQPVEYQENGKTVKRRIPRYKLRWHRGSRNREHSKGELELNPKLPVTFPKPNISERKLRQGIPFPAKSKNKQRILTALEDQFNRGEDIVDGPPMPGTVIKNPKEQRSTATQANKLYRVKENGDEIIRLYTVNEEKGKKHNPIPIKWHKPFLNRYEDFTVRIQGQDVTLQPSRTSPSLTLPDETTRRQLSRLERELRELQEDLANKVTNQQKADQIREKIRKTDLSLVMFERERDKVKGWKQQAPKLTELTDWRPGMTRVMLPVKSGHKSFGVKVKGKLGLVKAITPQVKNQTGAIRSLEQEVKHLRGQLTKHKKDLGMLTPKLSVSPSKVQAKSDELTKAKSQQGQGTTVKLGVKGNNVTKKGQTFQYPPLGKAKDSRVKSTAFRDLLTAHDAKIGGLLYAKGVKSYEIDHVIDLSLGGSDSWDNLWPLYKMPLAGHQDESDHSPPDQYIDLETFDEVAPTNKNRHVKKITSKEAKEALKGKWFVMTSAKR